MRNHESSLYLHEEVMLLALRDDKGTVEFGSNYVYAICGAILAELLMAGRITIEPGKKRLINATSDKPLGDAVLDECLGKIHAAKRRATVQTWLNIFWHVKCLHHRVAEGLCAKGILRADEKTVLLIFRRKTYPEINPLPEQRLIERLRKAIFEDEREVDPKTVVLISLAKGADLLDIPLNKKDLRRRRKHIEMLVAGEMMGAAAREAVEAAQAAALVAAIIPAVACTTVTS